MLSDSPSAQGCRSRLLATLGLLAFATLATGVGLWLMTTGACAGLCERAGLSLYAAGAPISGFFSALAGGLPLAWPVDITLWVVVGLWASGVTERRMLKPWRVSLLIVGGAVLYGVLISTFVKLV